MSTTNLRRLLNTKEAAEYLGMTEAAIYQRRHRKQIPVVCFGRSLRFDVRALDEWIEEHKVPDGGPA